MYRLAWALLATLAVVRPVGAETAHRDLRGRLLLVHGAALRRRSTASSRVTSGYTGGTKVNPTYEEVSAGGTGHAESVEIVYDPAQVSYEKLLDVFWHNVDPTTTDRQFCDVGHQYRSRDLLPRRRRRSGSPRSRSRRSSASHTLARPDRDRDRGRRTVLPGRGVSPGLLQEESDPLSLLPLRLRPRSARSARSGARRRRTERGGPYESRCPRGWRGRSSSRTSHGNASSAQM